MRPVVACCNAGAFCHLLHQWGLPPQKWSQKGNDWGGFLFWMLLRMISFWVRCLHCATVANAACFTASNDFVANQVSLSSLADYSALPPASTDLPTIQAAIRVRPFWNDYRLGFASSVVMVNIVIVRIWRECRGKAHQQCDQGCLHGSQHDTGLSGECPSKAFKEKETQYLRQPNLRLLTNLELGFLRHMVGKQRRRVKGNSLYWTGGTIQTNWSLTKRRRQKKDLKSVV